MQSFLLKIEIPDELRQKDVIDELREALILSAHIIKNEEGSLDCPYAELLKRVKIKKYSPKRATPKVARITKKENF